MRHLFILSPNNSGSTFIQRSLLKAPNALGSQNEGQYHKGFKELGHNPVSTNLYSIWSLCPDLFENPEYYDWPAIRELWYEAAKITAEDIKDPSKVFIQKSPPDLLRPEMLKQHFESLNFILTWRDPWCITEGILRQSPVASPTTAAVHACNCLRRVSTLIPKLDCLYFSYEELCKDPESRIDEIIARYPQLRGLTFSNKIPVKRKYNSAIKNHNTVSKNNLRDNATKAALDQIEHIFKCNHLLLEEFGYSTEL